MPLRTPMQIFGGIATDSPAPRINPSDAVNEYSEKWAQYSWSHPVFSNKAQTMSRRLIQVNLKFAETGRRMKLGVTALPQHGGPVSFSGSGNPALMLCSLNQLCCLVFIFEE